MEFTLPASKNDPFRKGIKLTIASTGDTGCPVHAMERLKATDTHGPPHAPLFCNGQNEQKAFTREYVVGKLQELATGAGCGHEVWNGHSFHRGAATWAAQVGIPEHQIQTLGRWRSDAYKTYIEIPRAERIKLSRRFQNSAHPTN